MFVMYSVWGLLWSFYWGWGLALQVRLGKHLGEGDIRSAKLVVKLSIFIVAIVVIIVDIACMALSHDLPLIFTKDPEVVRKAGDAMHILCLDYLMGCSTLCATSILEGMARNTIMSVVLSAVSWGVSMPAAIYFAFYCPWFAEDQIHGFWWGSVLGETVKSIVLWTIVYKTNWKQMAIDARERSERDTDVIVDDDAEAGDEEEGRASSSAAAVSPGGVSAIEEQLLVSASPRMSASPAVRRSPRVG
jgi:Na+-driven multidrug efflux pump